MFHLKYSQHIETAPKELLGEFPRMTRAEAANAIFQTEAKNKGWITEGPDAVQPPVVEEDEKMETEDSAGANNDAVKAPSHIKLDPIQEKLFKAVQGSTGLAGSRWGSQSDQDSGAPLAVQQAMAMVPGRKTGTAQPGMQSHGVRNNGAFNQVVSTRRNTVGLLGPAPENHWTGTPFGPGGFRQPPGLMDRVMEEDEANIYMIKQRIVAAKVNEEFNEPDSDDGGTGTGTGDETPEVTPPNSREVTPTPDGLPPNLPKTQMKLLQRIQQKQKESGKHESDVNTTQSMSDADQGHDDGDWYGDEDAGDTHNTAPGAAPFTINNLNLPPGLTNVLTAIQHTGGSSSSPGQEQKTETRKQDPRRNKNDPRRQDKSVKETEEELERKKDERIMDLDLGSFFGDLELPPLTVSPERTEEEKVYTDALGLPFKPHIMHEVAKEIDASYASHSPIDWSLRPVNCPRPDYSDIKHMFSNAQLEADPRLRKFAKSGMAKLKELPLPSFPAPKSDPRLAKSQTADRRRSSEDSEAGVYNPAKELSRAKKLQEHQQQQQRPDQQPHQEAPPHTDNEAYSPGQEYYGEEDGHYDEGPDYGAPPPNYPPFDHPPGYPPPGGWNQPPPPNHHFPPPPGRGGYPPRGPPGDPFYHQQGPGPYGPNYGPPRGKFNGPPRRGNFNRGGGVPQQNRKDPRKRN